MSSDDITPESKPEPVQPAVTSEPAPEAALPPPPRFETQPYVPDGNFPPLGLALTLGGGLAAAVLLGFLVSVIAQWMYIVVVFPAFIGLALGGIGMAFIQAGKLRNPLLAGVAALLSGVMAIGTMHYVNYQRSLDAVANAALFDRAELENRISFFKYLDLRAEEGVTISRAGNRKDKGMNLGYVGSYIYWLLEVVGVVAIAWAMMRTTAAAPFCIGCNAWKNERRLAELTVPAEDMAVQAVNDGDVLSLLSCAGPIQTKGLVVKAAVCPHCGADGEVDIVLDRLTKNAKGEWKATTLTHMTYPGEMLQYLPGGGEVAEPRP